MTAVPRTRARHTVSEVGVVEMSMPVDAPAANPDARARIWLRLLFAAWFGAHLWASAVILFDRPSAAWTPAAVLWAIAVAHAALKVLVLSAALRLASRFPVEANAHFARNLAVHLLAALGYGAVVHEVDHVLYLAGILEIERVAPWRMALIAGCVSWFVLAGAGQLAELARRNRRARLAERTLRAELGDASRRRADAELRALKADLNPHFLRGALGAVATVMRTDPSAAQHMVAQLGSLQRAALARARTQEVTLREELEAIEPFVAIEQTRVGRAFDVDRDIAPEALDALVPDMILQPLVEHAVRRRLSLTGNGRLCIVARRSGRRGDSLEVRVAATDDGSAAVPSVAMAPATAAAWVATTRARLAELYGARAGLTLDGNGRTEGEASITIPWRDENSVAPVDPTEPDIDAAPTGERAADDPAPPGRDRGARRFLAPIGWTAMLGLLWWVLLPSYRVWKVRDEIRPVPLDDALISSFIGAFLYTGVAFLAVRFTRRRQAAESVRQLGPSGKRRGVLLRALLLHVTASVVLGLLGSAVTAFVSWWFGYLYDHWSNVRFERAAAAFSGRALAHTILYLFSAMLAEIAEYGRQYRLTRATDRRLRAQFDDLRRRRAEAELRALKAELNPHFLGNALNAVSTLARTDPAGAGRVIGQLDELIRTAIVRAPAQEVPLREELEGLEPFLAVEEARLGRPLDVHWSIDEPALDARVPHMILQPLIENAVKHGLAGRGQGGIVVSARRRTGSLELCVQDDGAGIRDPGGPTDPTRRGVGLVNTQARLAELYGTEATFELASGNDGGVVARLVIPWRNGDPATIPANPIAALRSDAVGATAQ